MASREELAAEAVLNEYPGIPRITVRPEGVRAPPIVDDPYQSAPLPAGRGSMEGGPQPPWGEPAQAAAGGWGSPEASTGRPSMRLFEPDMSPAPVKPQWQPGMLSLVPLARGLGGVVQGARDSFNAPAPPPPQPRAPVDPTAGPRQMFQQGYRGQPPSQPGLVGGLLGEALQAPQNMFSDINVERHPASTPEQVAQAKRQLVGSAAETAMNIAGPGLVTAAARPGASAGVFGGRLAKTYNPQMEKLAAIMETNGVPPQQIWKETGMVKFADGKWAHEIPDIGASYKGDVDSIASRIFDQKYPDRKGTYGQGVFRGNMARSDAAKIEALSKIQGQSQLFLPDVIDHPELFRAYPELKRMPVSQDAFMHAQGVYYPESIAGKDIRPRNIKYREETQPGKMARGETFDTLLHEIQHAIAQIEGMARGSSTEPLLARMQGTAANKYYQEEMKKAPVAMSFDDYSKVWATRGKKISDEDYAEYLEKEAKARRDFSENAAFNSAMRAYPESAGENLAELPPQRKDMTPEQLRGVFPPSQFRVPMEQQSVEFNRLINPAGTDQSQFQLGGILRPTPQGFEGPQMSASGLMPPKSQRKATGSMNPLDEQDVTWKGKPMSQFNPQDWKEFGDHYGVKNMGPLSKVEKYISPDGYTFEIPGGTKGTWTYYDLLHMKANPINPHNLPHELHAEMQKKLGRTMTPHGEVGQDQIWNGLMFGMTSASNPLFPNQLSASRLRLRDPKMLDALADSIPWKAGETVPKEVRAAKDLEIGQMFNLHEGKSAGSTGLGTRGGVNYTYIAELAQMFRKNPEWFRKKPDEEWIDFVERLGAQTKGLSMKTGSFGSVWQDPYMAAISAIDRHMVKEFERRGGLFLNQAEQEAWQAKTLKSWNKDKKLPPDQQIQTWKDLTQQRGFEDFMSEKLLEYVGAHSTKDFRNVKGEINPSLPEHLRKEKWFYEPKQGLQAGEAYKRALAENQKAANEQGLNLFMSQWFEWDRIRQRFEPHENMFPGLSQMPAPSARQLQVPFGAHAETGHTVYDYGPTGRMNPTKKFPRNPSEMGYLGVPLAVGGAAGLGSVVDPSKYQPEAR